MSRRALSPLAREMFWTAAFCAALAWLLYAILPARGAEPIARWGFPEGTVIEQGPLRLAVNGSSREARWVLEYLDESVVSAGKADRAGSSFTSDERVPKAWRASGADYAGGAWDKGHLAPADDFGHVKDQAATFDFVNCVPQAPQMNRVLWRLLEAQVRASTAAGCQCWVLTVPLFESGGKSLSIAQVGPHRLWVPTHLAKALLVLPPNKTQPAALPAWVVPNARQRDGAKPDDYRVPLAEVETAAGLEIWPALAGDLKQSLETKTR